MTYRVFTVRPYRLAYLLAVAIAATLMVGPLALTIVCLASIDLELS